METGRYRQGSIFLWEVSLNLEQIFFYWVITRKQYRHNNTSILSSFLTNHSMFKCKLFMHSSIEFENKVLRNLKTSLSTELNCQHFLTAGNLVSILGHNLCITQLGIHKMNRQETDHIHSTDSQLGNRYYKQLTTNITVLSTKIVFQNKEVSLCFSRKKFLCK